MKEATDIKFLGLELDKYMNWQNQIERILPKNEQCMLFS